MSANARVIKNSVVFVGEYDMSGDENEINLNITQDQKEATVMSDVSHLYKPGLIDMELTLLGYTSHGATQLDDTLFVKRGTSAIPVTVVPEGIATPGNRAWLLRTAEMGYEQKLAVGEMPTFKLTFKNSDSPMVGGVVLDYEAISSLPFVGTAFQAGAIGAAQKGYATLHVMSITGSGTLTVKVRSCSTAGGTYVDRITFTGKTARGSDWGSVNGAVTDQYWKVEAAQTGSITAATIMVGFGIQ